VWTLTGGTCFSGASTDTVIVFQGEGATANADSFYTDLNTPAPGLVVLSNDVLGDFSGFDLSILNGPSGGAAVFNGDGTLTYTPADNFYGADFLVYEICSPGCPDLCDTALVILQVGSFNECHVPNVFTPNFDGTNDELIIRCVDEHPFNRLQVFNRWGDLVHDATNYRNDWQGTYAGGDLPVGTYFYVFVYFDENGFEQQTKGYFLLHR
jgi:gliding motility-associated-like protein